MLISVT